MILCQFCIFSIRNTILVKLVQRSLCNTRVLNLGINQLMSDLILRLRIESEIDPNSVFELGVGEKKRNLQIWTRNFRKYPDTPVFHPDTPDLEVYITLFYPFCCSQMLLHCFLSFPLSLTSSPFPLGPKP